LGLTRNWKELSSEEPRYSRDNSKGQADISRLKSHLNSYRGKICGQRADFQQQTSITIGTAVSLIPQAFVRVIRVWAPERPAACEFAYDQWISTARKIRVRKHRNLLGPWVRGPTFVVGKAREALAFTCRSGLAQASRLDVSSTFYVGALRGWAISSAALKSNCRSNVGGYLWRTAWNTGA
jgi:hypothetical protein